jgi:predicted nucleotidyltransferase
METSAESRKRLEALHLDLVRRILASRIPGAKTWVFGSRSRRRGVGSSSDLDLAVDAGRKLTLAVLAELREDFVESDLPFSVDVVDLHSMDPVFRNLVEPDFRPLEDAA